MNPDIVIILCRKEKYDVSTIYFFLNETCFSDWFLKRQSDMNINSNLSKDT